MADIKISREHSLNESGLQANLEKLAAQMQKQFGIQYDFKERVVHLSGAAVKKGKVSWTSDSLAIELSLGLMGKMFKRQIQEEIEKQFDAIVAV